MMISLNALGFIVGRAFLVKAGGHFPDRILLGVSAAVGSSFYVLTILTEHYTTALVFMFLAGFGMCGDQVALYSLTALRFRRAAAKALAFMQAAVQIGAASGTYLVGFIGQRHGSLEESVWIVPITIYCVSLVGFGWEFRERWEVHKSRREATNRVRTHPDRVAQNHRRRVK